MISNFDELITIIMPAYNSQKYISSAINSVINQTYQNWELIVVDDGSSDKTKSIVSDYISENDNIKLFSNNHNMGVVKSRNKGIKQASGNWIAFLDSDDLWESDKLQKQVKLILEKQAEFIFTGSSYINENDEKFKGTLSVPKSIDFSELKKQNIISCSSVLVKRDFVNDFDQLSDTIHEDYAMWLTILRKEKLAYGINEPLLIYRISTNSKSGNKLKTLKMTYGVFRYLHMSRKSSFFYTMRHTFSAFRKYYKIFFDSFII